VPAPRDVQAHKPVSRCSALCINYPHIFWEAQRSSLQPARESAITTGSDAGNPANRRRASPIAVAAVNPPRMTPGVPRRNRASPDENTCPSGSSAQRPGARPKQGAATRATFLDRPGRSGRSEISSPPAGGGAHDCFDLRMFTKPGSERARYLDRRARPECSPSLATDTTARPAVHAPSRRAETRSRGARAPAPVRPRQFAARRSPIRADARARRSAPAQDGRCRPTRAVNRRDERSERSPASSLSTRRTASSEPPPT
jgi:hypothetical protein